MNALGRTPGAGGTDLLNEDVDSRARPHDGGGALRQLLRDLGRRHVCRTHDSSELKFALLLSLI